MIAAIAKAHNVSAAQVALRWIYQHGHVLTVLSENPAHQANDADLFGFALSEAEMARLDRLQPAAALSHPTTQKPHRFASVLADQCEQDDDCPPSPFCTVVCAYVPSQGRKCCVCA